MLPPPITVPDDEPVPAWHLQILEERRAAHHARPEEVLTWAEAEQEILYRLQKSSPSKA